jgi:hypothetical protein
MTIEISVAEKAPLIKDISNQLRELTNKAVNWTQRCTSLSGASFVNN